MKPTFASVKSEVAHLGLTDEEIAGIYGIALHYYDAGFQQASDDDLPPKVEEKIGVDYAYNAFKDCKSPSDFEEKLKEVQSRHYQFMPTLGL